MQEVGKGLKSMRDKTSAEGKKLTTKKISSQQKQCYTYGSVLHYTK